jgi:RND family efflux transporter MFP subunit
MTSFRGGSAALLAMLLGALALSGCGARPDAAAGAEDVPPVVVTHFSPATELFVEFPALAVGDTSMFAAHLTDLVTFKPVTEGQVIVRLVGPDGEERFSAGPSTSPGIFKPEAKPASAGQRRLLVELRRNGRIDVHDLGLRTVYPSREAADKAQPPEAEIPGEIAFYKEQQWKVDFATAPVGNQPFRASIPVRVLVHAQPNGEAAVSAPAAGVVQSAATFPYVGMNVRAGQPLLRLRPIGADAGEVGRLSADRARAAAELTAARADLARVERLLAQGAVSRRRLDEARARVAGAQGAAGAAGAGLAAMGGAAGPVLAAPITGQVTEVTVQQGQAASSGQVLVRIVDPRRLELEARVAEADVGRLVGVAGLSVQPPGGEPMLLTPPRVSLEAVGAAIDPATRTVPVVFQMEGGMATLPIGLSTTGRLLLGSPRPALAVPRSAIVDDAGLSVVYVLSNGEAFLRRVVRLGIAEGTYVEILDGLKPGDRVVTRGAYLVRLAEAGPAATGAGHVH